MQSSWSTRPSQLAARPLLGGSTWEKKLKPLVGTTLQQLKHRYAWGPNVCNCSPDELAAAALLIAFGGGGPRSPEPGPQGPSPAIFCKGFADLLTFTRLGRGCTSWGARPENQCRIYKQENRNKECRIYRWKCWSPQLASSSSRSAWRPVLLCTGFPWGQRLPQAFHSPFSREASKPSTRQLC